MGLYGDGYYDLGARRTYATGASSWATNSSASTAASPPASAVSGPSGDRREGSSSRSGSSPSTDATRTSRRRSSRMTTTSCRSVGCSSSRSPPGWTMKLDINGKAVDAPVPRDTPLLWVIREEAGLTGTKFGCGRALCGACTVHVDGAAKRSCVTAAGDVEGKAITTIEGLAKDGVLHAVQQAWLDDNVVQCGYCQGGQIMSAAALLAKRPTDRRRDRRRDVRQPLPLRDVPAHPRCDSPRGARDQRRRRDEMIPETQTNVSRRGSSPCSAACSRSDSKPAAAARKRA